MTSSMELVGSSVEQKFGNLVCRITKYPPGLQNVSRLESMTAWVGYKFDFGDPPKDPSEERWESVHFGSAGHPGNDRHFVYSKDLHASKWSQGYMLCQGILLTGVDADGAGISFLLHSHPRAYQTDALEQRLREEFRKFRKTSRPGTIQAFTFGGKQGIDGIDQEKIQALFQQVTQEELDIDNIHVHEKESFDVFYSNSKERLLVLDRNTLVR